MRNFSHINYEMSIFKYILLSAPPEGLRGMLAHEMAHAIIDDFLQVRPPMASAEILARYVDAHLND